jgi:hypothetical protein
VIRNLFSIFDTTTEISSLPLNWTSTAFGLLLIRTRIWLIPSRNSIIVSLLIYKLHQEIKTILRKGNENKGNSFILTSLFHIILTNNFLALFPYIFTRTKHLTLTLCIYIYIYVCGCVCVCVRLFEVIVGVLTTCHTQYTWDSSTIIVNTKCK